MFSPSILLILVQVTGRAIEAIGGEPGAIVFVLRRAHQVKKTTEKGGRRTASQPQHPTTLYE